MDNIIRKGAWGTAYDGTEFRIVTVDLCSGSNFTECHHLQVKGENTAKCMNGSKVLYVAPDDGIVVCTECGKRHQTVEDSMTCDHAEADDQRTENDDIERQIMSGESDDVIREPRDSSAPRFSYRNKAKEPVIPPTLFSHRD